MSLTPYSCPFIPVKNFNITPSEPYFADASCSFVEEIVRDGAWWWSDYGVPEMFGGTVEITVTPGDYNETLEDRAIWNLSNFNLRCIMLSADGASTGTYMVTYNDESPYQTVYEDPPPVPLQFGENYTFKINTSKLVSIADGSTPIPQDGSMNTVLGLYIRQSSGGVFWTLVGLNFIPNAPAANIFWTANKGCTEMP